jgi:hypothetical protein
MRFRSVEGTFFATPDPEDTSKTFLYHIEFSGLVTPRLQKWREADPDRVSRPNKYVDWENGYEYDKAVMLLNAAMRIMGPCRFLGEFLRRMSIVPPETVHSVDTEYSLTHMQETLINEKGKRSLKIFVLESRQAQKLPKAMLRIIGNFLCRF